MLHDRAEALEADFARYYQLDLLDLWRGHLTPRRAAVLTAWLPAGAESHTGHAAAWSVTDYLLRSIEYSARISVWQQTQDGEKNRNAPVPFPSPTDDVAAELAEDRLEAKALAFQRRQQKKKAEVVPDGS